MINFFKKYGNLITQVVKKTLINEETTDDKIFQKRSFLKLYIEKSI